jgi:hypothetical protein
VARRPAKRPKSKVRVAIPGGLTPSQLLRTALDRLTPAQRRARKQVQREALRVAALKRVRQYATGFSDSAGYTESKARKGTLSKYQKSKLKLYDQFIRQFENRSVKVVRQKKKKNLKLVQQTLQAAQDLVYPRQLKVGFIVTPDPKGTRVSVRKGAVIVRRHGSEQRFYYTDPERLKEKGGVLAETRRLLKLMPEGRYYVMTGVGEASQQSVEKGALLRLMREFYLQEYGDDRVGQFFRGFRFIGTDDAAVQAERDAWIKAREEQNKKASSASARRYAEVKKLVGTPKRKRK